MVFKQAEAVWDYYKSTRLFKKVPVVVWIGILDLICINLICIYMLQKRSDIPYGIYVLIGPLHLGLTLVIIHLVILELRSILAKKYSLECATYRLNSFHDKGHLRYVLFLRKLADQKYTREDIANLRRAVEIAEIPTPPGIQFNEHPLFWLLVIVPAVGALWTLGTDFVKQTDFWKGKQEAIATLSAFGVRIALSPERSQEAKSTLAPLVIPYVGVTIVIVLITVFCFCLAFLRACSRKTKYQEIQRFLQWAEHDIEEAKALRAQRLRLALPSSYGHNL